MKWRIALLLAMFSLLLTSCNEIDQAIDDAIPLSSMAFINVTQGAAEGLLLPLKCLVPIAFLGAVAGIKRQNWGKVRKMLGLLFGIGLLPYILPVIADLGRATWPDSLTLSWIASQLGWEFPIPSGDANPLSFMWALSFTINWPLLHAVMQIVVTTILVVTVIAAVMTWSWRPLLVGLASVAGWVIAPSFIGNVIELLGSVRPDNTIINTLVVFNLIYVVALVLAGLMVYVAPPILVMVFMPTETESDDQPNTDELPHEETGESANTQDTATPFPFPWWGDGTGDGKPEEPPESVIYGDPPNYDKLPDPDAPIDGEFRDVEPESPDDLRGLPAPAVIGDDGADENDFLPADEAGKSSVDGDESFAQVSADASADQVVVISDDSGNEDELRTQPPEAATLADGGEVALAQDSDAVADVDLLPDSQEPAQDKVLSDDEEDPFVSGGTFVITDDEEEA